MAGYKDDEVKFYHIRIDRMQNVMISDDNAISHNYNSNNYVAKHFQMWDGDLSWVELIISNEVVDSMMDKFGEKLLIQPIDEAHARIQVQVAVSKAFFSWIVTFGDNVKIITKDVKAKFIGYIAEIVNQYRNDEE
jgi:predicted DNA-binding transcriptional regulator YafY